MQPSISNANSNALEVSKIYVENLNEHLTLDEQWSFTRQDNENNKFEKNDSEWVMANPFVPWNLIYDDKKNFKFGWYQKRFEFAPQLIGKEVVILLDTYTAKIHAYKDGKLVYSKEEKSRHHFNERCLSETF